MTLSYKFGIIRAKFQLDEMPENQARWGQAMFHAGAQAAFQILAATSDMSREGSIIAWKNLQDEIIAALPESASVEPEEEKRIVTLQ